MLGTDTVTHRGFPIVEFVDAYGKKCSIQCSSAIGDTDEGMENPGSSFLWVGLEDAEPKIMCSRAAANGVEPIDNCGWQPFPIPEDVSLNTRMHLSREQVAGLIERLQQWLDDGQFESA